MTHARIFMHVMPMLLFAGCNSPRWCNCGNCRFFFESEKTCCCSTKSVCMLQSHEQQRLRSIVLDEVSLRTAINGYHLQLREITWNYSNENFRHIAYKQYVSYQHGHLGRGQRISLPNCFLWAVRDKWPSGHYTGYKP